eukprot:CAMPEP_0172552698 /NCGR_PEP_ID=MMETSP1067-20121228/46965_1 /TAXON_ID=265564 ORGANISM="Thalassiosira punctigera, Strain Tpunct2005C2" /NCGR_SAMPLE_ID=MMETSP1067 /ASSEMBLY_ACC=CAM_ASM_000444 /LENGTH=35 /DNA_ID= /DNA_START= /DNA_END= /DNA_ORIENTATION=
MKLFFLSAACLIGSAHAFGVAPPRVAVSRSSSSAL